MFEKKALSEKVLNSAIKRMVGRGSVGKYKNLNNLLNNRVKIVANEYAPGNREIIDAALGDLRRSGINNPAFIRALGTLDSTGSSSARNYLLNVLRRESVYNTLMGRGSLGAALDNTASIAAAGGKGAYRAPFNGITTRAGVLSGGGYDSKLIGRPYSDSRRAVISLPNQGARRGLGKNVLTGGPAASPGSAGPITRPRHPIPPFPPPPPRPPMPPRYNPQPAPTRPAFRGASLIPPRPTLPPRPPMPSPWPAAVAAAAPIAGGAAYMANN